MKIIANLLITKDIYIPEEISFFNRGLLEYINHVDRLYIYNVTNCNLDDFYASLKRFDNIEYTSCDDLGEVLNYERMLNKALEEQADFCVNLELGYYYEESAFTVMKNYIQNNQTNDIAIISPMPLYGCQIHEHKAEETRYVMGGCNFVGALINMNIYKEMNGLKKEYYQTTFDYEYCIRARLKGYKILLFNNEVLRNENYRIVEKRLMFVKMSTYDKDPLTIYYEYRNRLFLWEEYKKLDPYYVKLDKKLARGERHELRWRDPGYRNKLVMYEKAKEDFKNGVMGKIKYRKRELQN